MRTLAKYLQNYKKESVLAPFFKFLEVVFDLLVPIVVAQIIDGGIRGGQGDGFIWRRAGVLVLLAVVGLTCTIIAQYFSAKAAVGTATNLRHDLFAHMQAFTYAQTDRVGTAAMITRMTSDINQVQNGLNMALRLTFNQLQPMGYSFRLFHPGWVRSPKIEHSTDAIPTFRDQEGNLTGKFWPWETAAAAVPQFIEDREFEDRLVLIDNEGAAWPF